MADVTADQNPAGKYQIPGKVIAKMLWNSAAPPPDLRMVFNAIAPGQMVEIVIQFAATGDQAEET